MKTCTKCKISQNESEFYTDNKQKDKLMSRCKTCCAAYRDTNRQHKNEQACEYYRRNAAAYAVYGKKHYEENKEQLLAQQKARYNANRDLILAKQKVYNQSHKEEARERHQKYYAQNRDIIATRAHAFRERNKAKIAARARDYRERNRAKIAAAKKRDYEANKEAIRATLKTKRPQINAARRKRVASNPETRIINNLRSRVLGCLKGNPKNSTTMKLVGCGPKELRQYLESQFEPGMTWENYGFRGWHMDHYLPCDAFDMSDPLHQKACHHYSNLRPLWGSTNHSKKDKVPTFPLSASLIHRTCCDNDTAIVFAIQDSVLASGR